MTYCRLIAPIWLKKNPSVKNVIEGFFTEQEIKSYNSKGYGVYYWPNHPKEYVEGSTVNGSQVDVFNYVFVDFDCKSATHPSKDAFIEAVAEAGIEPSKVIDSGNGIHVYWKVSDLDALSYLRLSSRFMRLLHTDDAVRQLCQLMRLPGTLNTKNPVLYVECTQLYTSNAEYTCEHLDNLLPSITIDDEKYCQQHYDKRYNRPQNIEISDVLPAKWGKLLHKNSEVKTLFSGDSADRSKDDFRLGHLLFANDFSKEEATSVLVNTAKALARAPIHRVSYAQNIVDKIWTYEKEPEKQIKLSDSVEDILKRANNNVKGTSFRCHRRIDNTVHGFRLGQVLGLVAGSGVGKTAFALNMFLWFCEQNPDYHHFFIPLEQPSNEIADRWQVMCQGNTALNSKVHVMSNYDEEGNFRHLSLDEIKEYLVKWQAETKNKIGCVVIDHVGALKKKGAKEENQDLMTICHSMKAFAVQTNTFLVMQSQSSRAKAGIGDLELDKDAAYGTVYFEAYCDYLVTLWQPLKRCHSEDSCPTVTAFKFCKIRHKKAKQDVIKEDIPYYFYFDSNSETLRDLTQDEEVSFKFWVSQATNKRKADKKTELIEYKSVPWSGEETKNEQRVH